jgi:hypothetical protein
LYPNPASSPLSPPEPVFGASTVAMITLPRPRRSGVACRTRNDLGAKHEKRATEQI